jgi:hypothetical protein
MRRRRRGAADWAALIDQWKQSGVDLQEFCQRQGLNRGTMPGWVYKSALKRAIEPARRGGPGVFFRWLVAQPLEAFPVQYLLRLLPALLPLGLGLGSPETGDGI